MSQYSLVAANGMIEQPEQTGSNGGQQRQQDEKAAVCGTAPKRANNSRQQTSTKDGQKPCRHSRRSHARRRQACKQTEASRQNVKFAEGENHEEQHQPKPAGSSHSRTGRHS